MSDEQPSEAPPNCPKCGIVMRSSTRRMRTHGIVEGRAIPRDSVVDVWRCPACGRETPRS